MGASFGSSSVSARTALKEPSTHQQPQHIVEVNKKKPMVVRCYTDDASAFAQAYKAALTSDSHLAEKTLPDVSRMLLGKCMWPNMVAMNVVTDYVDRMCQPGMPAGQCAVLRLSADMSADKVIAAMESMGTPQSASS